MIRFGRASLATLALIVMMGCAGDGDSNRVVLGGSQAVGAATVQTFARMSGPTVEEAGIIVPFSVIQNPPEEGTGPAGAIVSIPYPAEVQQTTVLNHYEMQWEPHGHPPDVFLVPHFDIHSYSIPESEVFAIAPPDTVAPTADRLPTGYVYPGTDQAVPQMGVHAINPADLTPPFTHVMIAGFWGGNMIFLEPMVTQETLLAKQDFTLTIAQPQRLGRVSRYPTRFRAMYDAQIDSYRFVFDQFVNFTQ